MKVNFHEHIVPFASFASFVVGKADHCPSACQLALSHVTFPDVNVSLDYYPTQCCSKLRVASVYVCIRQYCSSLSLEDGRTRLNGACERYANITLPPVSIIDGFSDEDIQRLQHFDRRKFDENLGASEIIVPDGELYGLALRSKDAWSNSVRTRTQYGHAMLYFWLTVVSIGIGCRISASGFLSYSALDLLGPLTSDKIRLTLKRCLLVPATFSRRCVEPYGWFTVPPRLQSAILLTYVILNIVLCCVDYDVFDGNLNWPVSVQWSRYIADRTGVISIANLPLIWLFATRNNLLLAITGWSFETAMQFHRWVARMSTTQAMVHSLAYTVIVFQTGDWAEYVAYWQMRYWAMGGLATVAMSLICVFSIYPMRRYFYELFLIIHILLGVLTLLGMWYHVEIFDGAYNWYIWPCLIIWLHDRLSRAYRLIHINHGTGLSCLEYNPESNAVWLTIPTCSTRKPQPGEYYFLYLFKDHSFYESHPFTLSSWDKSGLHFLIRPYNGFTERLARIGQKAYGVTGKSSVSCKVRVLAEGPYGATSDLRSFESIIFVVGGTGIAVALAYLTDLCQDIAQGLRAYEVRNFKIIWAVQHESFFRQVFEKDLEPRLQLIDEKLGIKSCHVDLDVFITKRSSFSHSESGCVRSMPMALTALENDIETKSEELAKSEAFQSMYEVEEVASERSSLLSSRTQSPVLEASTTNPGRVQMNSLPQLGVEQPWEYHAPKNTTLSIHHQIRPGISHLVFEACSKSLVAAPTEYDDRHVIASDRLLMHAVEARPRTSVVCCGPASLADATRAAVVKVLAKETTDRIEFINESYSW